MKKRSDVGIMAAICLSLLGCQYTPSPPAPVVTHHLQPPTTSPAATVSIVTSQKQQQRDQATSNLAEWPTLATPNLTARTVTVMPGDNISMLAKRYHVSWRSVAAQNGLTPPYHIEPGTRLQLPDHRLYIVQHGDTLSKVASVTGVTKAQLIAENRLPPPYVIGFGEALMIPYGTPHRKPPHGDAKLGTPEKRPKLAKSGKFIWPVKGKVIAPYGARGQGVHNDGINIKAASGAPIQAAAGGEVVYAGGMLKAYGNLVIIKHDASWFTSYAHQATILVEKGNKIRAGQIIGTVGDTGHVTESQLHFSIRNGKKPVNPMGLLVQ